MPPPERPGRQLLPNGRATSCPSSRRVAGCLGQRVPTASTWPARSAAAAGSPSARAPMMNTRRRRCGTPKKRESRTRQARPYPMSASVPSTTPKSRPPCEERRPGTFSTRSQRGRTASATRANSKKRLLRSPASPLRRPATERSWQGKPPQRSPVPACHHRRSVGVPPPSAAARRAGSPTARTSS